jgi:class 3 adenylate cyclase/alpha-beta hydrolase superfamily lysophospholipase
MDAPQVRYAKTTDGISIAYAVIGKGPLVVYPAVVWGDIAMYQSGVDYYARPATDYLVESGRSVAIYDGRGTGLSDREPADFCADARLLDLEAVTEATGSGPVDLVGRVQATAAATGYAVKHPDRVRHLILWNPYVRGADYYSATAFTRGVRAFATAAVDDWEFVTLTLANWSLDFSDLAKARALAAAFREGMEYQTYLKALEDSLALDVSELLHQVSVPTLVIRDTSRAFAAAPALAKPLASRIASAHFITVDGTQAAASAIAEFILEGREHQALASGTAVILFLDIAESTALTERLGDEAFREKARALDDALRRAITSNGGRAVEGKLLGDGVLATFGAAREAISCAQACHAAAKSCRLRLHAGIHAGDVIREENNVYGGAVNIASRIAEACAAGETLVSSTVRDLARTSAGVLFEDRGERELKGVGEPVRVWAVQPPAGPRNDE